MDNHLSNSKLLNKKASLEQWQRLSPIALLYFLIEFFQVLASNVFFLVPIVIIGKDHIVENPWLWLPLLIVALSFILLSVFLNFYFFQYRLSNDHIEIRSGVFAKKHVNLPFTRIQNIKLEQPIYYRPFNYTCLQLDTAGSSKQEAKIVALNTSFAEALKKEILATHARKNPTNITGANTLNTSSASTIKSPDIVEDESEETVLNTRSLKDLVIHGISNNRVWIFLGGLAPFFDNIGKAVVEFFDNFGIDLEQLFTIADKSWWQISLWALTLTFLILFTITLFSIAGSIISYYNFTLSKINDRYIRRSGLLTKHEVTMKLPRLQMIIQQQDWLDILLKRVNLIFEQNNTVGAHYQPGALNNKIVIPSVTPHESQLLIDDVFPSNALKNVKYTPISKRFLLRNIVYILLPIYIIASVLTVFNGKLILLAWATVTFTILSALVICRWYRWGYAIDNNFVYIRKGVIGVDYHCFPIYKVQQTQFIQSVFLKRHNLCSAKFILASGALSIPYIKEHSGYNLINRTLFRVEESRQSWM